MPLQTTRPHNPPPHPSPTSRPTSPRRHRLACRHPECSATASPAALPCPAPAPEGPASEGAAPFTTRTINSTPASPPSRASSARTRRTLTSTVVPAACRTALLTASCTTRYAVNSTAGSNSAKGSTSNRTSAPARRVPATSSARSANPGCGPSSLFGSPLPGSSHSKRSTRRISVSDARASSAIPANSSRAPSGKPAKRCGALSARTTTTERWCATTSCNSRAIRARSCHRARCARSAALMLSCSMSCCRASARDLNKSPTTTATRREHSHGEQPRP